MPRLLKDAPAVAEGLAALRRKPGFKKFAVRDEELSWTQRDYDGFPALLEIILGQQVSIQAAAAMWRKLTDRTNGLPTPESFAALDDEALRACGFSRQKIRYGRALADNILSGALDPALLTEADDETLVKLITDQIGFGLWSAQMYMIFVLGRGDIWPHADLGIQEGLRIYSGWTARPDAKTTAEAAPQFTPHRTAASLLLWVIKHRV